MDIDLGLAYSLLCTQSRPQYLVHSTELLCPQSLYSIDLGRSPFEHSQAAQTG
jgi:hypothetical protein